MPNGEKHYEIDEKLIEMFKDHPENLKSLIDAMEQKEIKLSNEKTKQDAFTKLSDMFIIGCKTFNNIYECTKDQKNIKY